MTELAPVIAIDGPSGTGKGTLCGILAVKYDWHLLDSGALYRLVALAALKHGVHWDDEAGLAKLAAGLDVHFSPPSMNGEMEIRFEGENVVQALRTEDCGRHASVVSAYPEVRAALLQRQRDFRQPPGLVADGRDMGTTVFPDAEVKIFLTASPGVRAERRHKQLMQQGISVNLAQLSADIAERDIRDSERRVSPLRPADDAIIVDTSDVTIQEVVQRVSQLIRDHLDCLPELTADSQESAEQP